jgi:hypothetical protein
VTTSLSFQQLVVITEVDDGPAIANELFQHRFAQQLVSFGRHYFAFYKGQPPCLEPLGYLHVTECGDIGLVGGGCTDDRLLSRIPAQHASAIREHGGTLLHLLQYIFHPSRARLAAYYGVCGNPRALEVILKVGFKPTAHDQLLVYCPRPSTDAELLKFTEKARSFMPF